MVQQGVDYKIKNNRNGWKNQIKIQIWDTAGQERYRTLTKSYYKGAAGIVLTFDVTDEVSFSNVEYWIKKIKKHGDPYVKIILLGNKIDLFNERVIPKEKSEELCAGFGIPYFETSAKESSNVDEVFKHLVSSVLNEEHLKEKVLYKERSSISLEEKKAGRDSRDKPGDKCYS